MLLCHQIPMSVSLSASWFAESVGAILAWIQPNQHFMLSPAVTEPRLWLSMPEPHQMLGYVCLLLAIHLWLSWVMGKPAAVLAGRDSQHPEGVVCLARRSMV